MADTESLNLKGMTKEQLKAKCIEFGLSKAGNKSALQARVRNYLRYATSVPQPQLPENKKDNTEDDELELGATASSIARQSKRSSSSAKLRDLKAQREILLKEEELRQAKAALEQKQAQLAAEIHQIKIDNEIAALEAVSSTSSDSGSRKSPPPKEPKSQGYVPPVELEQFLREATATATNKENTQPATTAGTGQAQSFEMDTSSLLQIQLMTFDGNPMEYHLFVNQFDGVIGSSRLNDALKLSRLLHFCSGEAKRVILPCAMMSPDVGYKSARQILSERFGDDYVITETHVKSIVCGAPVKPNNAKSLQKFCDDVRSCCQALKAMGKIQEIDNRPRLVKIVERLPLHLQSRWRKEAVTERKSTGKYPGIEEFVNFLDDQVQEIADPVYGIKETAQSSFFARKPPNRAAAFTVNAAAKNTKDQPSSERENRPMRCALCNQEHLVYVCEAFKKMSAHDRVKLAGEKHLCFNCLKFGKHSARECRSERVCNFHGCKGKHSYLLHDALVKPLENSANNASKQELQQNEFTAKVTRSYAVSPGDGIKEKEVKGRVALPIVPVQVYSSSKVFDTLALLDPGSNMTFCSQELVKEVGVEGQCQVITIKTLNGNEKLNAASVSLEVCGVSNESNECAPLQLQNVLAITEFPSLMSSVATTDELQQYEHLRDLPAPNNNNRQMVVSLLIGEDNPSALVPIEVKRGNNQEPYAVRTELGWSINGPISGIAYQEHSSCYFTASANEALQQTAEQFWKIDSYGSDNPQILSRQDARVLNHWDETARITDGHYELEIPFKEKEPQLPDNKPLAEKRLQYLSKRLKKDEQLLTRYKQEIDTLVKKGYAEHASNKSSVSGMTWYIPHHAVFNVNKPDKLRVVFDCSASYKGVSLNSEIHQGPDLTNSLVGVLLRFREGEYAIMADIEAMFHQVVVPENQRDALRFLWWQDGDPNKETEVYRMTRHTFGGVWCPSAATYALRRLARDNSNSVKSSAIQAAERSFYVDDMLQSAATESEALDIATGMMDLCRRGGFNLTKWLSNSKAVLESLPGDHLAKCVQSLDLSESALPNERALGLEWATEEDVFKINVKEKEAVFTKRGLLSYVSSVFDPLGFVSPFILTAKLLFQEETKLKKDWDDKLDEDTSKQFMKWLEQLPYLQNVSMKRHMLPIDVNPATIELHHFADASSRAYGTASYIRSEDSHGNIHVTFVFGKSRLAPVKSVTIPRLELMAAVVAVNVDEMLKREFNINISSSYFWIDSMAVLGYIRNESKKFDVFVNNRLARIHDLTTTDQWHHVPTELNPADDASRGLQSTAVSGRWLHGPEFLRQQEEFWPNERQVCENKDLEHVNTSEEQCMPFEVYAQECKEEMSVPSSIIELMNRYSCYYKQKRAVVWLRKFLQWLKAKKQLNQENRQVTVDDLTESEWAIIKCEQRIHYSKELVELEKVKRVSSKSAIFKLEPHLDENGIIRIGGRLKHAPDVVVKNQALLPANSSTAANIIREIHVNALKHAGPEYVLSSLREKFWMPKARGRIKSLLHKCVVCKILFATPKAQRMADLPPDRLEANIRPFANTGVDCFGPFLVKRGRCQEKRYGCIFTCLVIRAVHIEVVASLDADSFINAVMRFAARRGCPALMRCDNGTNFVRAAKELNLSIKQWNARVKHMLLRKEIKFIFNPPAASHMGGVWERQIRSIRRILCALMRGIVLDDERLVTFMCEAEAIINNRPMTRNSSEPSDDKPLSPSDLLLMRGSDVMPIGQFSTADIYNKRWRHVQYLCDKFWKRWSKEYIATIQHRQKWQKTERNLSKNDVVLVCDEQTPRNLWPLGRIIEVTAGRDKLVRSAVVKTRTSTLRRPITKLCLLEAAK